MDAPDNSIKLRHSRTQIIMLAIIAVLATATILQGLALIRMRSGGADVSPKRRDSWLNLLTGKAARLPAATTPAKNDQVIVWKANDDLDYIHSRINHLLRSMHMPFGLNPAKTLGQANPDAGRRIPGQAQWPNDLTLLRREIDRIFAEAYRDFQNQNLPELVHHGWDTVHASTAMNIEDQGQSYLVTVALPGYHKDEISVAIEGRLLKIKARAADCANYHETISAQIILPHDIAGESARAEYSGELLRIQVPRPLETNLLVRHIAIR